MFKESDQIEKFEPKVWLSSPTMHGEEFEFLKEAYETNWMSTVGANINEVERLVCKKIGCKYAVGLSAGTAALHMAVKLAGVKPGEKVFCSDMTFSATVNPIVYEGGVPVFIDTEYDTWNMDPEALEKAFELYPDVKVVVIAHLYGTPGKVDELRDICEKHGAVIIEDAAESMGATYKGLQTGTFGKYNAISFNGNKIITGSSGGMLLTDDKEAAEKVRKWSTQSRENAPWYQHEELGYNYRMSNVIAGVVRGQMPHLEEHIAQKKAIYERYKEGLKGLPVRMNPYNEKESEPNFWLSCLILDKEAMCRQVRSECEPLYIPETGKSCPTEILEAIASINAEGRPIWKPMHMQPVYRMNGFVTREGDGRAKTKVKDVISEERYAALIEELGTLPEKIQKTLDDKERIQWFASKYANAKDVFFIGRGIDYAISMEGSLKMKEISYIHSEAYAAGELKHGTISLIEDGILVVGVATQAALFEKTISNMVEVKSRGAYLMGLTTYGNYNIEDTADFAVYVPQTESFFATSLAIIPLQLMGYYVSVAKGLDVDKPRNLAKSVTVE